MTIAVVGHLVFYVLMCRSETTYSGINNCQSLHFVDIWRPLYCRAHNISPL